MKVCTLTPRRINGVSPPQVVTYFCNDCIAEHGVIVPKHILNVEIYETLCTTDEFGNVIRQDCEHPWHGMWTARNQESSSSALAVR